MSKGTLQIERVSKSFGAVRALTDVSFVMRAGAVSALVGENGAGKSTLLKILSGAHQPDVGRIRIDGSTVTIAGPKEAEALGIAIIYQELSLIPWLSVAQNLVLGHEHQVGGILISRRRLRKRAREMLDGLGVDLDPDTPVAELGVAAQQMVEIARTLSRNSRFVLMDEPTAALSERETDLLLARVRTLKARGVAVAYISHRLEEITRVADTVTVLRDGAVVHDGPAAALPIPDMVAAMVGRPIADHFPARDPRPGAEMLRVTPGAGAASSALTVHSGEVLGLAGLVGAGRTEFLWRLVGAAPAIGEEVRVAGKLVVIRSPVQARALGIGMLPESRKEHGLVLGRPVSDNTTITIWERLRTRLGLLDRARQAKTTCDFIAHLRIRCTGPAADVATLSGGNQQKVVLAKWLARDCRVLLLDEPTRGIDVGAKLEMYRLINDVTAAGRAVVLVSSDLPELIAMSDRIMVMHQGTFVAELNARGTNQREVLQHASGLGRRAE